MCLTTTPVRTLTGHAFPAAAAAKLCTLHILASVKLRPLNDPPDDQGIRYGTGYTKEWNNSPLKLLFKRCIILGKLVEPGE